MDFGRDFTLLGAVVIAIAGIAGALIIRGLLVKIVVLLVALAVAGYVAGLWHDPFGLLP
jgi:hypothetical protein